MKRLTLEEHGIVLSHKEEQIFELLLMVNHEFNLGITFRVAGGC